MRIISIALVLVLSVVLLSLSGSVLDNTNEDHFPEKLTTRVELKDSGDVIQVRFIQLSDDGEKLVMIRSDFRNGATIFNYFRDDGTLREEVEYFPSDENIDPEDLANRQVRRVTLFANDGETKNTVSIYRENGTFSEFTRLRVDGKLETESYSDNGEKIVQRAVRTKYGKLLHKEIFDQRGVRETVVLLKGRDTRIVNYQSDGISPKSLTIRKPYRGYTYSYGAYYNPKPEYYEFHRDGVTIAMKVTYRSYGMEADYFSNRGALLEEREYSNYGTFKVRGFYSSGQKRFEQIWTGPKEQDFDIEQYTLVRAKEYNKDGSLIREVEFYPNKNPKTVRFWDQKSTYSGYKREFNEDGILQKETPILDWREYGEEIVYGEEDEQIKADLPSILTNIQSRDEAPKESELPSAGL